MSAVLIIVILNVTMEGKEAEQQQAVKTFKARNSYGGSESHKETKNKMFLLIKRQNISEFIARMDLRKFLGRSLT